MARSANWAPRRPDIQIPAEEEARYESRVARTRKHLRLPTQKLAKWGIWCTVNKMDFQDLVEKALDQFFESSVIPTESLGAQAPTIRSDDLDRSMTLFSSRSSTGRPDAQNASADDEKEKHLLEFYCTATGNRLKIEDRTVYRTHFAQLEPYQFKIGVFLSIQRAPDRVNSLLYCKGAIEEIVEKKTPAGYLQHLVSALSRPVLTESLTPEKLSNLRRACALQPNLPSIGADVVPLEKRGKNQ